jgi:HSP20 family protein
MHHNQGFQGGYKGGCGSWGQHKGQWNKGKFAEMWRHKMARFNQPPVNIAETDSAFTISLFAAGLQKEKVTLTVKNDVLTISYPGAEGSETGGNYAYQEHRQGGFERQFQLNNKVLTDQISAAYTDGILTVTLPKNPETNVPAQTITVA